MKKRISLNPFLLLKSIKRKIVSNFDPNSTKIQLKSFLRQQNKYAFQNGSCCSYEQYEASITRMYHTVEKGLSYLEYRPGFGKDQIAILISSMEQYAEKYDTEAFFYRTALSCLFAYTEKNREYGYEDVDLEKRINALSGTPNECGGVICFTPYSQEQLCLLNFDDLMRSRHSIRHFSTDPVDIFLLHKAIELAQYTPSACNRQGWKTRIVEDKTILKEILENQNGNRGFGNEIDKLLVITNDLRYYQKDRELFQVFIDGGMYAGSILNSLYYYGIASIPLSASLYPTQEANVRSILNIEDAEQLILFVGVGNYPEVCQTTKSTRKSICGE